ncbi:MAG: hypothetical protein AB1599_10330 [Planctomycetota bacterium]
MIIRFKELAISTALLTLLYFIFPITAAAQDIPSSETFLKKYTLTESFEVGMEFSYMIPNSNKTNNMGNVYLTLTHSTNTYSSYKFKTGLLNAEYLLYNQNLGRIYFVPIMTTFISSVEILDLNNPKPYYGIGVGYYFFENFKSAQKQYRTYETENTYGYHLLVGAKYVSEWGLLVRGEMTYETIKPFRFFNNDLGVFETQNVRRVDFSNLSFGLNAALYF